MTAVTSVRQDNFDLMRLLAALMVLWSHQFALLAQPEVSITFFNSSLGLVIFFAISGYLNTQSLLRNPSWWRFLVRRAYRIYPGLLGAAVFCAVLGAAITTSDSHSYWSAVPRFVFKNTTILFGIDYELPGVFKANPYPNAVNGSLWTLPIEVKFYIYLALIAVAVRYQSMLFLGVVLAVLVGVLIWFHVATRDVTMAFSQRFAVAFAAGSALALLESIKGRMFATLSLAALAGLNWLVGGSAGSLPAIALVVILFGRIRSPGWLRPPIDISYGVYLYAFPVQQLIAGLGLPFWLSLGLSLLGTLTLACMSAICIERPALGLRPPPRTKVVEQAA